MKMQRESEGEDEEPVDEIYTKPQILEKESDIYNQSYPHQSKLVEAASLGRNNPLAFDESDDDDGRVQEKRTLTLGTESYSQSYKNRLMTQDTESIAIS